MIFVPNIKELVLPITHRVGVRGHFKIETQAEGQPRRLRAEFNNLITNLGLDLLCSTNTFLNACAVGSGNATPTNGDTALQTLVGATTSVFSETYASQSSSPYYGTTTITYSFAAGVATGNLAEVGVGASATSLMSRALILTSGGSPTTITVLSSEALYVTYQLEQVVPLTDVTGTAVISGTSYGYTLRAGLATGNSWETHAEPPNALICRAYNGAIGSITGQPAGTSANADSISTAGYSTGTYTLNYTAGFSITAGNLSGGITAVDIVLGLTFSSRGYFQIGLGTAIPKTGSNVLTLNMSTVWSR